jgi:hypothetical protein
VAEAAVESTYESALALMLTVGTVGGTVPADVMPAIKKASTAMPSNAETRRMRKKRKATTGSPRNGR